MAYLHLWASCAWRYVQAVAWQPVLVALELGTWALFLCLLASSFVRKIGSSKLQTAPMNCRVKHLWVPHLRNFCAAPSKIKYPKAKDTLPITIEFPSKLQWTRRAGDYYSKTTMANPPVLLLAHVWTTSVWSTVVEVAWSKLKVEELALLMTILPVSL